MCLAGDPDLVASFSIAAIRLSLVRVFLQEAEERHRQALWADEGTNGASFMEENELEEGGGIIGNDEMMDHPAWRLVLRRLVDHNKFQVS